MVVWPLVAKPPPVGADQVEVEVVAGHFGLACLELGHSAVAEEQGSGACTAFHDNITPSRAVALQGKHPATASMTSLFRGCDHVVRAARYLQRVLQ